MKKIDDDIILISLRNELLELADDHVRLSSQRFFKEEIKCYGLKSENVKLLSKKYFKLISSCTKTAIFELCESLWKSGFQEEGIIACHWTEKVSKQFEANDIELFKKWIETYIYNWATCDTFCNHTVGALLIKFPHLVESLHQWAVSDSRWLRRAAAVSLIVPARKGLFLTDIFAIANLQLADQDDMVQKGYGWLLKVASKMHEEEVFEYVVKNRTTMPRTAFRYAIEKLPDNLKRIAMGKA